MQRDRCQECALVHGFLERTGCELCRESTHGGRLVCDLTRAAQSEVVSFECHGFQPRLSIVGEGAEAARSEAEEKRLETNPLAHQLAIAKLMKSDEVQYQKALALQQLTRNPDEVIVGIRLHYIWNTAERRPLFDRETHAGPMHDIVGGIELPSLLHARLLWLARDHLHVYCEIDELVAPDTIARGLKAVTEQKVQAELADVAALLGDGGRVWDDEYFAETVG